MNANNAKPANTKQYFLGSGTTNDPFLAAIGAGCCGSGVTVDVDKKIEPVRFDNSLAHTNPTGGVLRWRSVETGFVAQKEQIIEDINAGGVGFKASVIVLPTNAILNYVGVTIRALEPGLTFKLTTRNGLTLPTDVIAVQTLGDGCSIDRAVVSQTFDNMSAVAGARVDIMGNAQAGTIQDRLCLYGEELILEVLSLPTGGKITDYSSFDIAVAASFDVLTVV